MSEPIKVFESQEQLDACLKEWQERLFLSDWIIAAKLTPAEEMAIEDAHGVCTPIHEMKKAAIQIVEAAGYDDMVERYCGEKFVVHELLHCKYFWMEKSRPQYEWVYFDVAEHANLEQMAKSLVMAKYQIGLDWFKIPQEESNGNIQE